MYYYDVKPTKYVREESYHLFTKDRKSIKYEIENQFSKNFRFLQTKNKAKK